MGGENKPKVIKYGDVIDRAAFEQILEMDEDKEGHDFSRGIVAEFLDQARQTIIDMDKALEEKDLKKLSELGHFLKGSSATIGVTQVKNYCEKIQNLGAMKDQTGIHDQLDASANLLKVRSAIEGAKAEFSVAERLFTDFYQL